MRKSTELSTQQQDYLECEKLWIFSLLMAVGGFLGAFTYILRGGVFCNAQTGNLVLLGIALGERNWVRALYLILPISAYFLGALVSEALAGPIRKRYSIRWDTVFITIEMVAIVILGLLPEHAPYQITQVTVNFICSMQYNTFRQAQGISMATTFCTNHLRQFAIAITKYRKHRDPNQRIRLLSHLLMLAIFIAGGAISTILCHRFLGKAIFFALIPLAVVLVDFLYADLKKEKARLDQIPGGH